MMARASLSTAIASRSWYGPRHDDAAVLRQLKTCVDNNQPLWMRRNIGSMNLHARATSAATNQSRTGETGVLLAVDLAVKALSLNPLGIDIHDLKKVFLPRDGSVRPLNPTVQ